MLIYRRLFDILHILSSTATTTWFGISCVLCFFLRGEWWLIILLLLFVVKSKWNIISSIVSEWWVVLLHAVHLLSTALLFIPQIFKGRSKIELFIAVVLYDLGWIMIYFLIYWWMIISLTVFIRFFVTTLRLIVSVFYCHFSDAMSGRWYF